MKIIAFEGIDSCGKTVQSSRLENYLREKEYKVSSFSFPNYKGFFGSEIGKMLSGKRYPDALELNPKDMSLWYASDRLEQLHNLDSKDDYVIFNRFSMSNMAFQSVRIKILFGEESVPAFQAWLLEMEFKYLGLLSPDIYIILDVAPRITSENDAKKTAKEYISGKDLYEENMLFQEQVRNEYLKLHSNKMMGESILIRCDDSCGNMLDESIIHEEIVRSLKMMKMI